MKKQVDLASYKFYNLPNLYFFVPLRQLINYSICK